MRCCCGRAKESETAGGPPAYDGELRPSVRSHESHLTRLRALVPLGFLLVLAAPLAAQNTIYVDPLNGDDATGDGSSSKPYASLTHALATNPPIGSNVELRAGTYTTPKETFPITVRDRIAIRPGPGQLPVFDAAGAPVALQVDTDITQSLVLSFGEIMDCAVAFQVNAGKRVAGLVLENTLIEDFTQAGVKMTLNTGQNTVTVRNCDFAGSGADFGVLISVQDTASAGLIAGAIEDCRILDCDTGIELGAAGGADVDDSFAVRRNEIEGHTLAGVRFTATPGVSSASLHGATVQGNLVKGDSGQAGELGLELIARFLTGSLQKSEIHGKFQFNALLGNDVNLRLSTENQVGGGEVNITATFTGNNITGATGNGVVFNVVNPAALMPNNNPNLGDLQVAPSGGTGRNTIQGSAGFELVLDPDMQLQLQAENNFWNRSSLTDVLNRVQTNGALAPSVTGFLLNSAFVATSPRSIPADTAAGVTVSAPGTFKFVDNPDAAATVGNLLLLVAQNLVPATVADNGASLFFVSPALSLGNKELTIVNPGGQTASGTLQVSGEGSGGGGAGGSGLCVVATAAHGDYDAPEVRVLRRLRDDYFLMSGPGRAFTRAYYEHGPPVAEYIAERPWAQAATRAALVPPVAVARVLLAWNAGQRLAGALALLGLAFFLLRRRR